MGVWVCVSSETVWFPTLIGQKQGSLRLIGHKLTVCATTHLRFSQARFRQYRSVRTAPTVSVEGVLFS